MTARTLYVPVLIETAEQAEQLPGGTIAYHGSEAGRSTACRIPPIAALNDADFGWDTYPGRVPNSSMVGWTALVPVEAEEELAHLDPWEGIYDPTAREEAEKLGPLPGQPLHTRLVTPWEEA